MKTPRPAAVDFFEVPATLVLQQSQGGMSQAQLDFSQPLSENP